MTKLTEKQWKEFYKLGIDRGLVEEQLCGIWFKNIGCSLCVSDDKKRKLVNFNTKLQSK